MNIRKIERSEVKPTLENLEKILNENKDRPASEEINDLLKGNLKDIVIFSGFENGGEIATVVFKGNELIFLGVKRYAKKRGVGKALFNEALKSFKGKTITVKASPDLKEFYQTLGFTEERDGKYILRN